MTIVGFLGKVLRGLFLFFALVFFMTLAANMVQKSTSLWTTLGGWAAFVASLAILYVLGKPIVRVLGAPVRALLRGGDEKAPEA